MLFFSALTGCKKDFNFDKAKSLAWNPEFALVLVHDSITLRDVLTKGDTEDHLYIDESGNISILYYYNNDAFRIRPNDLVKLSPFSFSYLHQITPAEQEILRVTDLVIPPVAFTLNLASNNPEIRVDKLLVKEGIIKVTMNNTLSNDGLLTIKLLNATKNGVPFSFDAGPFVAGLTQTQVDISGVLFDLGSSPNTVQAEVEGLLKRSASVVSGNEIGATFEVSIAKISRFEGFLGHQTISQLEDTIRVNVFNNAFVQGEVYFSDPQATITVVNSIGIPTEITVKKLLAINNASGSTLDIAGQLGTGSVFQVPSPLINATLPAVMSMNYNNDNTGSAMNDFFNIKPDNVVFQVSTRINPNGSPLNFFSDTSSFYADIRVKLPLWGHFDHLTFQDTFDLAIDKPEELEHLIFRTNIINGLPLTALMQVYFTDDAYNKKDSLLGNDQLFIREAPVDPTTDLPYPGMYGEKDTTFILNTQRMLNLQNVKKVLVKAVLHSTEEGQVNVKLKADQMIKLNFSARAKLRKNIQPGNQQ
jgi:hypothetical protein